MKINILLFSFLINDDVNFVFALFFKFCFEKFTNSESSLFLKFFFDDRRLVCIKWRFGGTKLVQRYRACQRKAEFPTEKH